MIAACAATAIFIAVVSLLLQTTTTVTTPRPYSEPTLIPHVAALLIASVAISSAWGISAIHRCLSFTIGRYLRSIVGLMTLWLIFAILEIATQKTLAQPLFSYMQNAPPLLISVLFLFCILNVTAIDNHPAIRWVRRALLIALLLCLLVLSSDLYHAMLTADVSALQKPTDYIYGPGYYLCATLLLACMTASLALLTAVSRGKMRWRIMWLGALFALGAFFWITNTLNILGYQPGASALLGCLEFGAIIELCLELGFLPSVKRFRPLFDDLPFDLKIITHRGQIAYSTNIASPLDNATLRHLPSLVSDDSVTEASERSSSDPNTIYRLYCLHAGIALLTEDVGEIDRLQRDLEQKQASLSKQNELLRRDREINLALFRRQREYELYERVENDLSVTARQIATLFDELGAAGDSISPAERRQRLNLVKALVAYSKRKGMLALSGAETQTVDKKQLDLIGQEAMADLHSIGIDCAILFAVRESVPFAAANTVYDCFYDCVLAVIPRADPVIMTFVSSDGSGGLEMRVTIECAIGLDSTNALENIPPIATENDSWTAIQADIARDVEKRLAPRNATHSVTLDEGIVAAIVKIGSSDETAGGMTS